MPDRHTCACTAQHDSQGCDRPPTGTDSLCHVCRNGCALWAYLGAEDLALHLHPSGRLDHPDDHDTDQYGSPPQSRYAAPGTNNYDARAGQPYGYA